MEYIHDEALRVTSVSLMLSGETFHFRVHNTGGKFTVYLERHVLSGQDGSECKHLPGDPCSHSKKDLKGAADQSIQEHLRKCHYLKRVR